jgi:hypothetical protein
VKVLLFVMFGTFKTGQDKMHHFGKHWNINCCIVSINLFSFLLNSNIWVTQNVKIQDGTFCSDR